MENRKTLKLQEVSKLMIKQFLIILLSASFLSCQVQPDMVNYIELRTSANHEKSERKKLRIEKRSEISDILKSLNNKSRYLVKFIPTYEIEIVYKSGEVEVYLLEDRYLKKDGISFQLADDRLYSKLNTFFKNQ